MSKLWQIIAGALGILATVLFGFLKATERQRDNAKDKAEHQERRTDMIERRLDQRQRADKASAQAKEEGNAKVEEARAQARTGRRDHFSSGMRDKD